MKSIKLYKILAEDILNSSNYLIGRETLLKQMERYNYDFGDNTANEVIANWVNYRFPKFVYWLSHSAPVAKKHDINTLKYIQEQSEYLINRDTDMIDDTMEYLKYKKPNLLGTYHDRFIYDFERIAVNSIELYNDLMQDIDDQIDKLS